MLFGTWPRTRTFGADDARGAHKDYVGARFQRHLDAVDELQQLARASGLSSARLCVGVLLRTPGLIGCTSAPGTRGKARSSPASASR